MYIGDKIIYLELHKTGCSHTRKLLTGIEGCEGYLFKKHNAIYDVEPSKLGDWNEKLIAGNIRNPWDWYVSLWAFGCMGKGRVRHRTTFKPSLKKPFSKMYLDDPRSIFIPKAEWRAVYEDVDNIDNFRKWLRMIHSEEQKRDLGKGFGQTAMSSFVGLLTFRYLKLYSSDFKKEGFSLRSHEDIKKFDEDYVVVDTILKNEQLEEDFKAMMLSLNIDEKVIDAVLEKNAKKTNTSKRRDYRIYYDEETINFVQERDRFIIDKFNYTFDK